MSAEIVEVVVPELVDVLVSEALIVVAELAVSMLITEIVPLTTFETVAET